jgi:hypothetical protein
MGWVLMTANFVLSVSTTSYGISSLTVPSKLDRCSADLGPFDVRLYEGLGLAEIAPVLMIETDAKCSDSIFICAVGLSNLCLFPPHVVMVQSGRRQSFA